jgi:tRNA A-37 threonylcarbamoyl transferase component Bud32
MLAQGSSVGGRYRLDSLIGEGGMASVWRAEDETLRRPVAIKLLYFRSQREPETTAQQFLREARIAASVQHRNVIHIVDFGTTDDGVPYMVMELLHGESLGERMQRMPRLAPDEVLSLAGLTLRGLAAVHDAGIVHRDLKPQNIFLQQDGDAIYPKIIDFGISRSLENTSDRRSAVATQAGLVVGTPHYMAPEQARGEPEIDKRADIYSMGAIIYEGITGRLPFEGSNPGELLIKIISSEAPLIRDVAPHIPEVISDVIAQAMTHQRAHRFVDARAFRHALQSAADQAFPQRAGSRTSEVPVRESRGGARPRAASQALVFESEPPPAPQPTAAEAPAPQAWGDFEGIGARAASARVTPERGAAAVRPRVLAERAATVPLQPRAAGERPATAPVQPRAAGERTATAPLQPRAAGERPATAPLQPRLTPDRAATAPLGRNAPERAGSAPQPLPGPPAGSGKRAGSGPLGPAARAGSVPQPRRGVPDRAATVPLGGRERSASAALLDHGARTPDAFEELIDPSPAPGMDEPFADAAEAAPLELAVSPASGGRGSREYEAYGQEGPLLGDNPLDVFGSTEALPLDLQVQPHAANQNARASRPPPAGFANKRREARAAVVPEERPRAPRKPVSKYVWLIPGFLLLLLMVFLLSPSLLSAPAPDDAAAETREAQNPATRRSQRLLRPTRPVDAAKLSPAQRELMD